MLIIGIFGTVTGFILACVNYRKNGICKDTFFYSIATAMFLLIAVTSCV